MNNFIILQVSKSFSFLCDRPGEFTLSFKVIIDEDYGTGNICSVNINCHQTQVPDTPVTVAKDEDDSSSPGEPPIECLNFHPAVNVGRSASLPLENAVYRTKSSTGPVTIKHFVVTVEGEPLRSRVTPTGSGSVLIPMCKKAGVIQVLIAAVSNKGGSIQLCPVSIGNTGSNSYVSRLLCERSSRD